jgi:ubiquinone/menaquinone biosynthesis C-methylase UbiE
MLPRILEPELMDTKDDAREYDTMDHAAVNAQFVTDLLALLVGWDESNETHQRSSRSPLSPQVPVGLAELDPPYGYGLPRHVLDLGAGTAQIPIELCRRAPHVCVTAVDAAESMLALARENVADAGLSGRIELVLADAKKLPFQPAKFAAVISNSILHHIAEPQHVIAEAVRVAASGGLLFHRDLCRPLDEAQLERLVTTYAGAATSYQRKLFADSLHAALTLDEIRELVTSFGFPPDTVNMTSDRHWTWIANLLTADKR